MGFLKKLLGNKKDVVVEDIKDIEEVEENEVLIESWWPVWNIQAFCNKISAVGAIN